MKIAERMRLKDDCGEGRFAGFCGFRGRATNRNIQAFRNKLGTSSVTSTMKATQTAIQILSVRMKKIADSITIGKTKGAKTRNTEKANDLIEALHKRFRR